jgi:hypothetical protein
MVSSGGVFQLTSVPVLSDVIVKIFSSKWAIFLLCHYCIQSSLARCEFGTHFTYRNVG